MLKYFPVIKTVILFIIPYVILYSIYIQLNGETSPGGGFQAGVIFSTGLIAFEIINGSNDLKVFFSEKTLIICGIIGVLIYATTGAISFIYDDNFLNYYSLGKNSLINSPILGQHIGIFIIELGVGLTVASIMCLIYLSLKE